MCETQFYFFFTWVSVAQERSWVRLGFVSYPQKSRAPPVHYCNVFCKLNWFSDLVLCLSLPLNLTFNEYNHLMLMNEDSHQ